jgi:hypothetical protein
VAGSDGSLVVCDGDPWVAGEGSTGLGAIVRDVDVGEEVVTGKDTNGLALAGRRIPPNPSRTLASAVCTFSSPVSLSPPSSVVIWLSICFTTSGRK